MKPLRSCFKTRFPSRARQQAVLSKRRNRSLTVAARFRRSVLKHFLSLFIALIASVFVLTGSSARAGPVVYTDREAFLAAAGDVHTIDFETLPDGSPSYFGALITPEFNYTEQGVTFSSPVPVLRIGGNLSNFDLDANSYPSGQRNWIIADMVFRATAVGIEFPGGTYLSLFDQQGELLGSWLGGGSGSPFFLGVVAEDWAIARAVVDQGQSSQIVDSFFFAPVPEPATVILLCAGCAAMLCGRTRTRRVVSLLALTCPTALPLYAQSPPLVDGHMINLNFASGWHINTWQQTVDSNPSVMPYIWVAASQRSTVVRIATGDHVTADGRSVVAGQIVGEYWAAPNGCRLPPPGNQDSGPSRTTVDFDGGVWVANRNDLTNGQCDGGPPCGHVVKIGNGFAFQWIDRNNNSVMDTSTGLGSIKDWPDDGDGICTANDVSVAEDELILLYQPVPATGTRTVAVDRNNNVWVGGTGNRIHGLLNAWTGQLHDNDGVIGPDGPFVPFPCGGYGGLVDAQGVLWSADRNGQLLRFQPDPVFGCIPDTAGCRCIGISDMYGLAADKAGNIWTSQWNFGKITRVRSDGSFNPTTDVFSNAGSEARGVTVNPANGDVWLANTFGDTLRRFTSAGALLSPPFLTNPPGRGPTGLAFDSDGVLWSTYLNSDNALRMDAFIPQVIGNPVSLDPDAAPYNYSDMTGVSLYHTIAPAGVLAQFYDFGEPVWVTGVSWAGDNGDGRITASARAADVLTDLGKQVYADVLNGQNVLCELIRGRYVQVRWQLNASSHNSVWPTLGALTVSGAPVGLFPDCNGNDVPDECDILGETSQDCNDNDIPDECELAGNDCNNNQVPDDCDPDCNVNGLADECDIAGGTSCDNDQNDVPDECFACCVQGTCTNKILSACGGNSYANWGLTCDDCDCHGAICCDGNQCRDEPNSCDCLVFGYSVTDATSCAGLNPCTHGACCWGPDPQICDDAGGQMDLALCNTHAAPLQFIGGVTCSSSPCVEPPPTYADLDSPVVEPMTCPTPTPACQSSDTNCTCKTEELCQGGVCTCPSGLDSECTRSTQCSLGVCPACIDGVCYMVKNRYISFTPGNPGRQTALRVTFENMPLGFQSWNGESMWVTGSGAGGAIETFCELGGIRLKSHPTCASSPDFKGATLRCDPDYRDWGAVGPLHIFDGTIVPRGTYEIQAIEQGCPVDFEPSYSPPLTLKTTRWGDVVGVKVEGQWNGPDGDVSITADVTAVLNKFGNSAGAPAKVRADVEGPVTTAPDYIDQLINITDVNRVLNAFQNLPYPFPAPPACSGQ